MSVKKKKNQKNNKFSSKLARIWRFIWEDNSVLSWIVNIILSFVIIKFLLYPGLGLLFGTSYPIVAVVSGSMEHPGGTDFWLETQAICDSQYCSQKDYYQDIEGISQEQFSKFPFKNGFNKGDIMFLIGEKPKNIKTGDVLVFKSNRADPVIHRVMEIWYENDQYHFRTKGDNNPRSYPEIKETDITSGNVVGKAVFRVPYLGWVKLAFVETINLFRG